MSEHDSIRVVEARRSRSYLLDKTEYRIHETSMNVIVPLVNNYEDQDCRGQDAKLGIHQVE